MRCLNRIVAESRNLAGLFSISCLLYFLAATAPAAIAASGQMQTQSGMPSGAGSPGTISTDPTASAAERSWDQALANELVAARNLSQARQNGANSATIATLQENFDQAVSHAQLAWTNLQGCLPESIANPGVLIAPAPAPTNPTPAPASGSSSGVPAGTSSANPDDTEGTSPANPDETDEEADWIQREREGLLEEAKEAEYVAGLAIHADVKFAQDNGHRDPRLAADRATAEDAVHKAWAVYQAYLDNGGYGPCTIPWPSNHYRALDKAIKLMFASPDKESRTTNGPSDHNAAFNEASRTKFGGPDDPLKTLPIDLQLELRGILPPPPSASEILPSNPSAPPAESLTQPSKPSQTSINTTGLGIQFQLRGYGGVSIAKDSSPSTVGVEGAMLLPLGNRILVGPSASFQRIDSFLVNSIGGGHAPSTFMHTSVSFENKNFGGSLVFIPHGAWQLGVQGGATIAGSTIAQQSGFCGVGGPTAPAGCQVLSTTKAHATIVGPFVDAYASHPIRNGLGAFVGYEYHRMKYASSAAAGSSDLSISRPTDFDSHYQNVVGGITLTFRMHHKK